MTPLQATGPDPNGARTGTPAGWHLAGWDRPAALASPWPPRRSRHRRLLAVLAVAWALVLVGTGIWYSLHGSPTVREQTTIAQAQTRVDEAVGTTLAAAGTGPVPAVSGYQKTADCTVTPVRRGAIYQRAVLLYTRVGSEAALLDRIASGLPDTYHPKITHRSLYADAGYYVAVNGDIEQPGVVRVIVSTGCRPVGHVPASDPSARPAAGDRAAIDPVLAALGAHTVRWSTHRLPCGVRTIEAVAGAGPASLRDSLHPAAAPVVSDDNAVAYRDAGAAIAARRGSGGQLIVTVTTGSCQ